MQGLSKLPPPPSGQKGMTLQQLGAPPAGQKGQTLEQILAQQSRPSTDNLVTRFGNAVAGNQTPDQGAMFSTSKADVQNPGTGVGIATKTAMNVLPDFVRTTLGFPAQVAGSVGKVVSEAKGLVEDSGGIIPAIKNYFHAVGDIKPYIETLKQIIPSAAQKVAKGDFSGAAQDIANHPFQQIAPFLLALEEGAKGYDKAIGNVLPEGAPKGAVPPGGAQEKFNTAMTKTSELVTKPVGAVADYAVRPVLQGARNLGNTLAKFATSQTTGISPETISRIISNPNDFSPAAMREFTREGVASQATSDINQRISDLSDTGKEYKAVRNVKSPVNIPKGTIEGVLSKHGITVDAGGKIQFNKESTPTSPGDRSALQDWYTTYGADAEHTSNSFLNARKGLDNLAAFDTAKTDAANVLARDLRSTLNAAGRGQVPGLAELDMRFSAETAELKKVKTDYFNKDGTLKDNAISKIANASNKGRESLLARLEQVSPGITEKIRTLKAVEDIHAASGHKVGTYVRGALGAGSVLSGNIPAIVATILSEPHIATQILRGYGKMLGIADATMSKIISSYESLGPKNDQTVRTTAPPKTQTKQISTKDSTN